MATDSKNRLVLALAALLPAERETRGALEAALEDETSPRVRLQALIPDRAPVITRNAIHFAEQLAMSRHVPHQELA